MFNKNSIIIESNIKDALRLIDGITKYDYIYFDNFMNEHEDTIKDIISFVNENGIVFLNNSKKGITPFYMDLYLLKYIGERKIYNEYISGLFTRTYILPSDFTKSETFDLINRKITMNKFFTRNLPNKNILCISENEKLIKLILNTNCKHTFIVHNPEFRKKLFLKYIETNLEPEIIKIENLAVVST